MKWLKQPKARAYLRLSPADLKKGRSLDEQLQRVKSYCDGLGLKLTKVHADEPVGTLSSAPAAGVQQSLVGLMDLLCAAEVQAEKGLNTWSFVMVTDYDRLNHPGYSGDAFADLVNLGKTVVGVGDPLDLSAFEKPKKKTKGKPLTVTQRLYKGREEGAKAGYHQSGPAPYGYRRELVGKKPPRRVRLVIRPDEAELVRELFKRYLRCKSVRRLVEWLESHGKTTRRGKSWSLAGVAWILKNSNEPDAKMIAVAVQRLQSCQILSAASPTKSVIKPKTKGMHTRPRST